MCRQHVVIAVQEDDVISSRLCNAPVGGSAHALVGLVDISYVRITGHDVTRMVLRVVVDDDDFIGPADLSKSAFDRLCDEVTLIIGGNDDANTFHSNPSSP